MNALQYLSATFRNIDPNADVTEDAANPQKITITHPQQKIVTNETEIADKATGEILDTNNISSSGTTYMEKLEEKQALDSKQSTLTSRQSSSFIDVVLFIPKFALYLPLSSLIYVLIYPLLVLRKALFYLFSGHRMEDDTLDIIEPYGTNDLGVSGGDPGALTNSGLLSTERILHLTGQNKKNDTVFPGESKYAPKSSISTILEESMEFDPDYQGNDDYFKSPSDCSPATPSIVIEEEESNGFNENPPKSSKSSSLNSRLLAIANNSTSSLLSSNNTPSENFQDKFSSRSNNNSNNFNTDDNVVIGKSTAPTASETPTRHRKKKKFIFPKLLFNFNIFEPPNLSRKTLVLDLDETLIHSLSRYNSSMLNKNKGISIEVKVKGGLPTLYHIYKRPYVEEFLAIVYQWFDLVCFTASIKEYADPVIDYLEQKVLLNNTFRKSLKKSKLDLPSKIFSKRYYRNSCIFIDGKGYVKDLSILSNSSSSNVDDSRQTPSKAKAKPRSRSSSISSNISRTNMSGSLRTVDYSKVIIIDNSPISYARHKDNGLMIEGWINDPDDTELMNLLPLLNSLRFVSDVRCVLGLKDGQRAFR